MRPVTKEIFDKIFSISQEVKNNLQKKGIVIPVENNDGSISFGDFNVCKDEQGFYSILDYSNTVIIDKINLPQTAIILANNLALGKFLDNNIIALDRNYGYAIFEEILFKKIVTNKKATQYKIDLCLAKASNLNIKKENCRKQILSRFEKLRRII